jgi:hypothetical protein
MNKDLDMIYRKSFVFPKNDLKRVIRQLQRDSLENEFLL